ncbi:hypothetical protein [Chitinophaga barathri]|uniref:Uncharacterized protein n=1 Tax=Chitinophaga barathri TaxID=1647451 RepID=A0A3N4MGW7_9BACT|nr:hypothetical protein [Chitinophaga barathri]RPD43111.1 hypothetical protein EG028_02115 [Chitinophaga barathri]
MKRTFLAFGAIALTAGTVVVANNKEDVRATPSSLYAKIGASCTLVQASGVNAIWQDGATTFDQAKIQSNTGNLHTVYGNNNCDNVSGTIIRVKFN